MAAANEIVQEASQSTGNMLSLFSQVSAKSVERHVTSVINGPSRHRNGKQNANYRCIKK